MSYLNGPINSIKLKIESKPKSSRSAKKAFSDYIIKNNGSEYLRKLKKQRKQKAPKKLLDSLKDPLDSTTVGIIGGGFAGLYAGLILQSLDVDCEIYEASDRVGGRIDTWYSTEYDSTDKDKAGLYGEVGGMRIPQFSDDMLPVQHLALSLNAVLKRNKLEAYMIQWRKFYYNSEVQRLRYNNMADPILAKDAALNPLNFGVDQGGDIPMVWITPTTDFAGNEYLPINKILDMVNDKFISKIKVSFEKGFEYLMGYDNYSMWGYLTNKFTLSDLAEYYNPAMGDPSDHLSYNVTSYLETMNVGTGMYSVSLVEMVLAVYDWNGSLNPYNSDDENIYMVTVDKGMQNFPEACLQVLNLEQGVLPDDGFRAQQLIGMIPGENGELGYSPDNLTPAAEAPSSVPKADAISPIEGTPSSRKERVFMTHKVSQVAYDPALFYNNGGMKVTIKNENKTIEKEFPYVISTLPNGAYLSGELKTNFFDNLSFAKTRAIRECNYMPAFKAFITFKNQFWAELGNRQNAGLGVGTSDRSNRQIVYPSYGYDAQAGVLQIYCWAQDAERMGALSDEERVNECLKGIQYLYPELNIYEAYAGYDPETTTKTWFWDNHSNGGAFALFAPGQFKSLYPTLLTPEFNGCLNIAGECCSVHHGWIVGALDSAYNAVKNILHQAGAEDKIEQLEKTWASLTQPDNPLKA